MIFVYPSSSSRCLYTVTTRVSLPLLYLYIVSIVIIYIKHKSPKRFTV